MKETSAILAQVDANSLAIIDELGRGTSPKEGLAIAWATLNALASRCRTLLATSHSRSEQSVDDEIALVPHGVHRNQFIRFACPSSVATGSRRIGSSWSSSSSTSVVTSQTRTVLSSDPDRSMRPSGDRASVVTISPCPSKTARGAPLDAAAVLNT